MVTIVNGRVNRVTRCLMSVSTSSPSISIHDRINSRALKGLPVKNEYNQTESHVDNYTKENIREMCGKCCRAKTVCICQWLPPEPVETNVRVIILQHPNEQRKGLSSSAPLVRFCLRDCHIIRGLVFDSSGNVSRSTGHYTEKDGWWTEKSKNEVLRDAFSDIENPPILLYPSENSVSMDSLKSTFIEESSIGTSLLESSIKLREETKERRSGNIEKRKTNLIIIDGTWVEARKMLRRSPSIVKMSKLAQFTDSITSIINPIRREVQLNWPKI